MQRLRKADWLDAFTLMVALFILVAVTTSPYGRLTWVYIGQQIVHYMTPQIDVTDGQ